MRAKFADAVNLLLVIHPGTLGDVLMAVPSLRVMRAKFPRHDLALVARGEIGDLLKQAGEVSQVCSLEGAFGSTLFGGEPVLPSQWREWLGRCDRAIGFLSDPEGTVRATLGRFAIAHITLRSPFDGTLQAIHQSARFIEIVEQVVPTKVRLVPPLRVSHKRRAEARGILRSIGVKVPIDGLVVVHPGSGSPHKCADPRLYAGVIMWALDRGGQAVMIEGPADGEAVSAVTGLLSHRQVPILKHDDLNILAAVLAQASLFVGNDSGVTHLAASVGAPTVALFGPTDPARWAPIGPAMQVLQGGPCGCRPDWSRVQACDARPCLRIDVPTLLAICQHIVGT
ncbi:MAG TPA: glycosyltransferase family 9 protein [Nitrospiraceae bacterium]|nr:glycosyltransferase family 9 protein [Nitrospiraceae bacterium]